MPDEEIRARNALKDVLNIAHALQDRAAMVPESSLRECLRRNVDGGFRGDKGMDRAEIKLA